MPSFNAVVMSQEIRGVLGRGRDLSTSRFKEYFQCQFLTSALCNCEKVVKS